MDFLSSERSRRFMTIGGILALTLAMVACEPPVIGETVSIPFVRYGDTFGGVYFDSVEGHTVNSNVVIDVGYTSEINAGLSLFSPPGGDIVSIQNEDVTVGSGVSRFTIPKSVLAQAADIVIKPFNDNGNNAIQLDTDSSEWLFLLD